MSQQLSEARLAEIATVSDAPVRTKTNRTFELPGGLYLGTALGYLAFLGIMCTVVFNPELAIPMFAFAFSIIAGFGLCWKWASMRPDNDSKTLSWGQFANRGVQTLSGKLTAFEASAQVLILPVLIVFWGICAAVIIALVK